MNMKRGSVFGASLLVAGTAIGGGVLAMPVLTGAGGFIPAVLIYLVCWLFMAKTAVLIMEVFLWSPKEVNLVSMAQMTMGRFGKISAWILYLYLFYSLTIAYIAGGGGLVSQLLQTSKVLGPLIFVLAFAPFVLIGPWIADRVNRLLMFGLILFFFLFVYLGLGNIDLDLLGYADWSLALRSTPIIFTAFGFQGLIPTLTNYLDRDPKRVKKAIYLGSATALFLYILWEALFLGIVPLDRFEEAKQLGEMAVSPLRHISDLNWLYIVGQFFAFFAIVTSFLGVTLGLLDFLADGLKVKKTFKGRFLLSLLIYLPPLAFALFNPTLFLNALQYGGGIGCALLLGLLPILMVWFGKKKFESRTSVWTLGLMTLFVFFELTIMIPWF